MSGSRITSLDALDVRFPTSRTLAGSEAMNTAPDKGAMHLATAAVVNAVWDLGAKAEEKPVWKLLVDMTPAELVRCVAFRYITDAITPDEALEILRRLEPTKREREAEMRRTGFPAYTTSAGWLGYSDEKLRALCREAVNQGWTHVKMKVGRAI